MKLIYAYIRRYKNFTEQELHLDNDYQVSFSEGKLTIHQTDALHVSPYNLHMVIGKTGAGKTNLLQLIGSKSDVRSQRKWNGEDDSYFLLYAVNDDSEYFIEICDVDLIGFPKVEYYHDPTIPETIRKNAAAMRTLREHRFRYQDGNFTIVKEYGNGKNISQLKCSDMALIVNSYDIHAFIKPPYPDEREEYEDINQSGGWLGRINQPYHRTSLWQKCAYISDYTEQLEPGKIKKKVSFTLSTHNFADEYPIDLPEKIKDDYFTYSSLLRDRMSAEIDDEAKARLRRHSIDPKLTNKDMFIHDLWADYALYLRKWVTKIQSYTANGFQAQTGYNTSGASYKDQNGKVHIDPKIIPDGLKMPISVRCNWLAQYIDRKGDGVPKGIVWQITDDIKDICHFLKQLDDSYFPTADTFVMPVTDMKAEPNQAIIGQLFERMEQYRPDDAGIFTKCLLPYEFTCLSSGEYQYAKVLGGIDDILKTHSPSDKKARDLILLLDEPETYMHPELARQFIQRLYHILERDTQKRSVQILLATHSPFMLSDVWSQDVTRLDIDKTTGEGTVCGDSEREYFGANIHTIMADGFFLQYTIGDYSRRLLRHYQEELLAYLEKDELSPDDGKEIEAIRRIIPHIGDELIQGALEWPVARLVADGKIRGEAK